MYKDYVVEELIFKLIDKLEDMEREFNRDAIRRAKLFSQDYVRSKVGPRDWRCYTNATDVHDQYQVFQYASCNLKCMELSAHQFGVKVYHDPLKF
jgi:hypothetical protein